MGWEQNNWACDASDVVKVDLVDNKCYKGQYEFVFDSERYWCGPIPLIIHNFDIIRWDWSDSDGSSVPLIDLFNEICKFYDVN